MCYCNASRKASNLERAISLIRIYIQNNGKIGRLPKPNRLKAFISWYFSIYRIRIAAENMGCAAAARNKILEKPSYSGT